MRGFFWTEEEDKLAQDLLRSGVSCRDVARRLGRSTGSVYSRNNIKWNIDSRRAWSDEEDKKLKEMWDLGISPQEIANKLGHTQLAVLARKKGWNLSRRGAKHPKTNIEFFRLWSERSAYVYGLFITDGCVHGDLRTVDGKRYNSYKVKITQSGDSGKELLESIQRYAGGAIYGPYYEKGFKAQTGKRLLTWLGKELVEVLSSYGIGPRKSFSVEVPPVPDNLFGHFFRGVVDGDGCITNDSDGRPVLSIVSASEKFLKQLHSKIEEFVIDGGTVLRLERKSPASDKICVSYRVAFSANQSEVILDWMYKDKESSFWLGRKWEKYQKLLEQQRKQLESV